MKNWRCLVVLALWAFAAEKILAGPLVIFHTSLGDIEVELYEQDKPVTVQNFLKYVEAGYYQNTIFHRCPIVADGLTDFVLQGGEFEIFDLGGDLFPYSVPTFPPIPDEFANGTRYSNVYGTLAMAKLGGNTNSATSSWFFNLTNNAALDAADTNNLFTVFGHVLRGTNVLNDFIGRSYGSGLVDLGAPFDSVPVNYTNNSYPSATNFYYVNISILSPQATLLTNGSLQISWTTVSGLTNVVEYATNFPPTWQTFGTILGNGQTALAIDTTTNKSRFYRVRILY